MNKLVEEQSSAIDWLRFVSECKEPWPIDRRYALELLAHIERLEALCDLAYSDGAQAGFNLGVTEDNDGLERIIESRKDAVKVLRRLRQIQRGK